MDALLTDIELLMTVFCIHYSIASDVRGKGIYIQRVGPDSLGEQIGLEVGDQILEVNGTSFMDITHNEVITL